MKVDLSKGTSKMKILIILVCLVVVTMIIAFIKGSQDNNELEEVNKQDINKLSKNEEIEHFEKMEDIFREIEQPIKQIVSRIKDNDSKELLFGFAFSSGDEDPYSNSEIVFMNGELIENSNSSKMEIFQSILGLEDAARELSEKEIIKYVVISVEDGENYDIRFYIDPALTPVLPYSTGGMLSAIVYVEEKDVIFDHEKFGYRMVESNWYLQIAHPRDE